MSASMTGRDHIPPRVFKEMTRLNKQRAKLEELLDGVNVFNAKSKAAEIGKILDKFIPNVEKMSTQVKKYSTAFADLKTENKKLAGANRKLSSALKEEKQESILKKMSDLKLQHDYEEAVAILERIPDEVLKAYGKPQEHFRPLNLDRGR